MTKQHKEQPISGGDYLTITPDRGDLYSTKMIWVFRKRLGTSRQGELRGDDREVMFQLLPITDCSVRIRE